MSDLVSNLAYRLLENPIDPIPRYKIMKEVLMWPDEHESIQLAREQAMSSLYVRELSQSQEDDGSWGRFYSRNKAVKFAGKTTETALIRAVSLGMDKNHPTIGRLIKYLESVLLGSASWPDRPEVTLEWPVGIKLVTAACLNLIDPGNETVKPIADLWQGILQVTLADGFLDEARFQEMFEDNFHQLPNNGSSLIRSGYILMLLRDRIPYDLEVRLTNHLINHARGIFLVNNRSLNHFPLEFPSRESLRFIAALDLLSYFPSASNLLEQAYEWLWDQKNSEGFWDFGQLGRDGLHLPLSQSWRVHQARETDCSIRILTIMVRMQRSCDLRKQICHQI